VGPGLAPPARTSGHRSENLSIRRTTGLGEAARTRTARRHQDARPVAELRDQMLTMLTGVLPHARHQEHRAVRPLARQTVPAVLQRAAGGLITASKTCRTSTATLRELGCWASYGHTHARRFVGPPARPTAKGVTVQGFLSQ
jgi:hypothetical protein